MKQIVFTFQTPWGVEQSKAAVALSIEKIGGKTKHTELGSVIGKWKMGFGSFYEQFVFYFSSEAPCNIRVTHNGPSEGALYENKIDAYSMDMKKLDKCWGIFVTGLIKQYPDCDFLMLAATPTVDTVVFMDNGVQQVLSSKSSYSPAYGKALIGGALFGPVGAVVGGMGGISVSSGVTSAQFAKKVLMSVRFSNGRLREGYLSRSSTMYNEIMVNMQRLSK